MDLTLGEVLLAFNIFVCLFFPQDRLSSISSFGFHANVAPVPNMDIFNFSPTFLREHQKVSLYSYRNVTCTFLFSLSGLT